MTGGKDCTINVLGKDLKVKFTIELYRYVPNSFDSHVRAIAFNDQKSRFAVGLYSGEIYEFSYTSLESDMKAVVTEVNQSHFARSSKWTNEVWGLTVLRDGDTFLTCSDDCTLRLWSSAQRRCLKRMNLNIDKNGTLLAPDQKTKDTRGCSKLRSVAVSPNEKIVAVGTMDGTLRIVDISKEPWKQVAQIKNRKKWLQDVKFSPDGALLAVGSHDAFIDVYTVPQFKLLAKIKKHSSAITHLDWSTDSTHLHSTCQAYELLFFRARDGKQLTSGATALRDEEWATWTTVLGWPVQGIFRSYMDGSDVNMVHRSNEVHDTGYKLLACGEDTSLLRVYRYPCLKQNSGSLEGKGHSSHVTNVHFNTNDTYLYSTGGEDQCVFQWKIQPFDS